jgi:DNA-binding MarR family transcriptional regulator
MARRASAAIQIPQDHVDALLKRFPREFEPTSTQMLFALRAIAQRINDRATEWLAPLGLTATKFNYLAVIYARRDTGLSLNEISELVHTANATVTSMVNSLVRDELVERVAHPSDGRSAVVILTPHGKKLFERAFRVHHGKIEETLAGFTIAERQATLKLLGRIADAFARD